jgi:hypothetical protein
MAKNKLGEAAAITYPASLVGLIYNRIPCCEQWKTIGTIKSENYKMRPKNKGLMMHSWRGKSPGSLEVWMLNILLCCNHTLEINTSEL